MGAESNNKQDNKTKYNKVSKKKTKLSNLHAQEY